MASSPTTGTGTIYVNGIAVISGPLNQPRSVQRAGCYLGRGAWSGDAYANSYCQTQMVLVFCNGMKDILVPIDKAGRLVLPKDVRDELSIQPGDILKISIHGNEVILRLKRDSSGFVRKGQALVFSDRGGDLLNPETVDSVLANIRGERITRLGSGLASPKRKQ